MTSFVWASVLLGALALAGLARPYRTEPGGERPSWRLLFTLALAMAVVVGAGYAWVGSPQHLGVSPDDAAAMTPLPMAVQLESRIHTLERTLEQQPQDARSWTLLARAQAALGRRDEASRALERAVALRPGDAGLLADHADFIARLQGPRLAGEPAHLIERALAVDARHPKALALAGAAAYERKDYDAAERYWERLVEVQQHDAAAVLQIRERIAQARQMAAIPKASAPTVEVGASDAKAAVPGESGQ